MCATLLPGTSAACLASKDDLLGKQMAGLLKDHWFATS
jgi:hypothetical protein